MKKIFKKTMQTLIITAIIGSVFAVSINAIAADNPCNPNPQQDPTGREVSVTCTYGNTTYIFYCCNSFFIEDICLGFIRVCPVPPPQS